MERTMKKKYQQPSLTTIEIEIPLLNSVSGEDLQGDITQTDDEAV
jgi:hypothetical protein